MEKETIYLIDGSAYIYRAYHAIASLTNSNGLPTNAVFGFVNMLRKLLKDKDPAYMCVAFDSRGPVFRHRMYDQYKANRPSMPDDLALQIPYIKKIVAGYNLKIVEENDYEADDLIASLGMLAQKAGHDVVVVSGDKDLLQLVDLGMRIWDPMKNKELGKKEVEEKYNVPVSALLDYFALIGDASDNVPGVPGVGPKTAAKLIGEYDSLDGIYEHVDTMKQSKMKEKIVTNRELAYLSRDLIRLKMDIEISDTLEEYRVVDRNDEVLAALYQELGFSSLFQESATQQSIPTDSFTLVREKTELSVISEKIRSASKVVFDCETTSLNVRKAELVGISLCVDDSESWYIPVFHKNEEQDVVENQIPLAAVQDFLVPIMNSSEILKIAHNLKYDYSVLQNTLECEIQGPFFDTMVAAYLVDPSRRSYKLDVLSLEMGFKMTSFTEVVAGDKREDSFAYVPLEKAKNYSCEDVFACFQLYEKYRAEMQELDVEELFETIEMPIVPILADMENRGICVDDSVLAELSHDFNAKIGELEKTIYELAGEEFNINSPKQLGAILFEKLELPYGRKTKTGYSTDVKVLEKLAVKHPLPAKILEYRTLAKLQSTYVEKLGALRDAETGKVYTSFNQTVTATGRLSSSNPNLQNIPVRSEDGNRIRRAFIPQPGMVFLAADYSQIDLRVLAHYSEDEALTRAFCQGLDVHESTAREIFSNPLFVSPDMRRVAKSINFGIVYGMSSFGLAGQLGISRKDAQTFIDRYFRLYTGVKKFMVDIVEQARVDEFVTTLCKRRRNLPEINAKNKNQREFAERIALNTPIQGTAADIIKLAMIRVERVLKEKSLQARLLLQIHDELVFELPESELEETRVLVQEAMENALHLKVPLVVNFETGSHLALK